MTDRNEALRLADRISHETDWYEFDQVTWCNEAAALLRQQAERIAELELQPAFAQLASDLAVKLSATEAERDQLRAEVEALRDSNAAKADRIDRLGEIVEALRADAGRLDWIEHQYLEDLVMGLAVDCEHDGQYYVCGDDNKTGYGDSLRAAIDHASTTHKDEG